MALPLILDAAKGVAEGLLSGANGIVKTIWGSKEARDKDNAAEQKQVVDAYTAEFRQVTNRTYFDSFVDGMNRLVRPSCTFGCVGLIVWAGIDPVSFTLSMQALTIVPEWLWVTFGGILAFWFGGRMVERAPTKVELSPEKLQLAREIMERRAKEKPVAPPEPPKPEPVLQPVAIAQVPVTPENMGPQEPMPLPVARPGLPEPSLTKRILDLLRVHEGWRENTYRCTSGKLTVGYGHNIDANGLPAWATLPLSKEAGDRLLLEDLGDVERSLRTQWPQVDSLDNVRYACLVDMAFNMGVGKVGGSAGLMGFKNTLRFIEAGEYIKAAENMMQSKWYRQTGTRARRIVAMMRTGQWPSDI